MSKNREIPRREALKFLGGLGFIFGGAMLGIRPALSADVEMEDEIAPEVLRQSERVIIYASNNEGNWEIYRMNLDTLVVENLTNDPGNDLNPQVSPDGKTMVFYSDRSGNNEIYSLDLSDPQAPTLRLTKTNASNYDPTFSPDGKQIAFKSNMDDGYGDILIMDADGGNVKNLTPTMTTTEEWKPTFTRDGSGIIFTSRQDVTTNDPNTDELFSVNLETGKIVQLTKNEYPDWYPTVDPETGKVVFVSDQEQGGDDTIYTMNEDGSDRTAISTLSGDNDDPAWGPGNMIIFLNSASGVYDIYQMNEKGENPTLLLHTGTDKLSPVFNPIVGK